MQQSVDVVGYPMGGDGISITAGIVSRIDWGEYSHSDEKNLVVVSVYFELIVHYISPT